MTIPKFSTQYDHHDGPEIKDFGPSLTKQEYAEESDINFIINQYETTGIAPAGPGREPIFGDFTDPTLTDYQQALNTVQGARELFERVPAKVRERFHNDPAELIAFVQDDRNIDEAFQLGLLRPDYVSPSRPPDFVAPASGPAAATDPSRATPPPNAAPAGSK